MRSLIIAGLVLACLAAAAGCSLGPVGNAPATGPSPMPSASTTGWVELVHVDGDLQSAAQGRASLRFTTTGGPFRVMVGFGPAPAWGVPFASFRYQLYLELHGEARLPEVPLKRFAEMTVPSTGARYLELGRDFLEPGTYTLIHWGAGWYGISVLQGGP